MTNYLDNICNTHKTKSLVCRAEAIKKNMPIIKFELPDDYESKFNSKQYFIYPIVNNDTEVKYVSYAGGGLNEDITDKFFLGLKFV